jgi:flotillin
MNGEMLLTGIIAISALALVGIFIGLLKRYKRCPSDKLLVVYGKTKGGQASEVIHGGAKFIIPIIQDYEFLSLKPMAMEIDLRGALSNQNIRVDVPASVTISISNQDGIMQNAANHLLGLSFDQIKEQASDIIFGQMRQVISNMSIEQINTDRDTFLENIQTNLTTELSKIGLKLINVNVKDIKDESGYIEALGKEAAAKAINDAKVKVAEENKTGDIGASQADQIRRTQVAEANAQAEIGEKEADMRNRIKTSEADSKAVEGENKAKVAIANSDSARKVAEAEANAKAVSAEKVQAAKAEEEALKQEKITEDARAKKVEATQKADIIVPAEIDKQKQVIDAQAEAEQIREIAKGKADAKYMDMEAEAKGIFEILSKTADGFRSVVEAAGGNPQAAIQMMMTDKMEKLMSIQAEAIKGIDIDTITVWDNGGGADGSGSSTTDFIQNFLKSAPQWKSIYESIGSEFPQLLQGAREIAKANNPTPEAVEDTTSSNEDDTTEEESND